MSYSSEQKENIRSQSFKNVAGRRAFLLGMLSAKGELADGGIVLRTETDADAAFACRLIQEFFGREATVSTLPQGGRCRLVTFSSAAAVKYLTDMLADGALHPPQCKEEPGAFLRGIFFACGRLCHPDKQYLLELSTADRAPLFLSYLEDLDIYPKVAYRRGETLLCLRSASAIEDFLMHAGMNELAYAWMNRQIRADYRNNANRFANCITNNIGKSVSTARRQTEILEKLRDAGLLSSLPEELEQTARLRLENPDLSMAQLAGLSVPAVSKPGFCHRMERLLTLAQELLSHSRN